MSKKPLAIIALLIILIAVLTGAFLYTKNVSLVPPATLPAETMDPASLVSPIQQTMLASSPPPETRKHSITAIIVTDSASPTTVTAADSKAILPASTSQILVVVELDSATTATSAVLKMTYLADDSVLGPVSSSIKVVNGRKTAAFGLNKPPAGWPTGPYTLLVVLPTDQSKELTFVIQ